MRLEHAAHDRLVAGSMGQLRSPFPTPREHHPGLVTQRIIQGSFTSRLAHLRLWHVPICPAKFHPGANEPPEPPCDGQEFVRAKKNFAGETKRWKPAHWMSECYVRFLCKGQKIRRARCLVEVQCHVERGRLAASRRASEKREWSLGSEVWRAELNAQIGVPR